MTGDVDFAYLLRSVPYRDSDLILTLLTKNSGLVSVIARSARKSRKRFSGALDFFCLMQAQYKKGASGLGSLTSAEPVKSFDSIREDLVRYHVAACILEITRLSAREGDDTPDHFDLLEATLNALGSGADPLGTLRIFQLKTIAHLGYAPDEFACAHCRSPLEKKRACWSESGLLCEDCRKGVSTPLSPGAVKTILAAVKLPLSKISTLKINKATQEELRLSTDPVLEKILGAQTRSQEQLYNLLSD